MKLKIQVIMGLVCLSCGYHAEGRVNPGVTELTKEQKEDLKKMWTLMFTKMKADLCTMPNMVIGVAYLN